MIQTEAAGVTASSRAIVGSATLTIAPSRTAIAVAMARVANARSRCGLGRPASAAGDAPTSFKWGARVFGLDGERRLPNNARTAGLEARSKPPRGGGDRSAKAFDDGAGFSGMSRKGGYTPFRSRFSSAGLRPEHAFIQSANAAAFGADQRRSV